jgi:hypothetical protein
VHSGGGQQLPGLGHGEPQVGLADLGQLALQPQPVQSQPHVMPGGQHEPQPHRRSHDQQLQLPQRLRAQLMHVVDHQPDLVRERRQVAEQPLGDRPAVQVRCGGQRADQPGAGGRLAQRAEHRQPELLRITLAAPGRHPRRALGQARLADPRSQQHGLAAAGRRGHRGHPGRPSEPIEQPGAGYDTTCTGSGSSARPDSRIHVPHHRISAAHMGLAADADIPTDASIGKLRDYLRWRNANANSQT